MTYMYQRRETSGRRVEPPKRRSLISFAADSHIPLRLFLVPVHRHLSSVDGGRIPGWLSRRLCGRCCFLIEVSGYWVRMLDAHHLRLGCLGIL
jgi:hypothetical protein